MLHAEVHSNDVLRHAVSSPHGQGGGTGWLGAYSGGLGLPDGDAALR